MRCLLLIAHGSRRAESNREIEQLAGNLPLQAGNAFDASYYAFLEVAEPTISQAVDRCVADGAVEIVVLPYFLSPGNHVVHDVPKIIASKQREHSQVAIHLIDHFGGNRQLAAWTLEHVNSCFD